MQPYATSENLTIYCADNLEVLKHLQGSGARFDLCELDGPYMAGLEDWDTLTEAEYTAHYAARLSIVREVLQPWGVVFVFGYPEGCAEIKSWAHRTETLVMRRWLSWYLNSTKHSGRKIQTILMFIPTEGNRLWAEFKPWLKQRRLEMGLKIVDACRLTGINAEYAAKVGGYLWFENESAVVPNRRDYATLKRVFNIPDYFDYLPDLEAFEKLTDRDFINVPPERATHLNDAGLRSKPIGLYLDLFSPVRPPRPEYHALVLYGGSGNAAIAAGQLGYKVTVVEQDAARCDVIARRWAGLVERRAADMSASELGPLFALEVPA